MEQQYFYLIGVGSVEDWDAGRGSLYYIEDRNGERAVPVFTTQEGAEKYFKANLNNPQAHMDMLEGAPLPQVEALTKGRFIIMPLDAEGTLRMALEAGTDYLIRDPRPGTEQEILRLDR